ncbi:unnamed protein product, partial [Mesorhabditis belari]|uniref:Uncharacterized protein n=1 Tax=Mesorhabditis belari TaxID=2138241 RepID=A0AAF3FS97_9BILA
MSSIKKSRRPGILEVLRMFFSLISRLSTTLTIISLLQSSQANREALMDDNGDFLPHIRLAKDLMDPRRYDSRVRPVIDHANPTSVLFSMTLYQILAVNEKQQSIDLNVWVIQKWNDDFLGWNPSLYGGINVTILPYHAVWLPDTYIYNSVVMNREETERYINVVVTTNYYKGQRGAEVKFMYPALYRTSCQLDIRFFPYDQQNCTLVISSWTSSRSSIDYFAEESLVRLDQFIQNEEWVVVSFKIDRIEEKFPCCPEPWVLLHAHLVIRRKPLYYIVNLVIPTSVITMVAVTGFFTAASTSSERREKLSLGIDSLLAMSILMMMVSEQMPTTSDYVPLFGLFYLTIIFVIFLGTLFTAFILNIHLQKMYSRPISPIITFIFFHKIAKWLSIRAPTTLVELWAETGVRIQEVQKGKPSLKRPMNNNTIPSSDRLIRKTASPTTPVKQPPVTARSADESTYRSALARSNWQRLARQASSKTFRPRLTSLPYLSPNVHGLNLGRRSLTPTGGFRRSVSSTLPEDQPLLTYDDDYGHFPASAMPSNASEISRNDDHRTSMAIVAVQQMNDSLVIESKLKRRYALEWEYLASVLDRVLLLVFSMVVFIVTFLMILVGEAMHLSYELNNE